MSLAHGIKAIHPSSQADRPHIFGYSTTRSVSDDPIFELWTGSTSASRVLRVNKDGQVQAQDGSVGAPAYSFEDDKDAGMYRGSSGEIGIRAGSGDRRIDIGGSGLTGVGVSSVGYAAHLWGGSFTSDGSITSALGVSVVPTVTGAPGDTDRQAIMMVRFGGGITTQGQTETISVVSSLHVREPNITVGSGDTVTAAATVYIEDAPTEGSDNYALWVDDGVVRLDGNIEVRGSGPHHIGGSLEGSVRLKLGGAFSSDGSGAFTRGLSVVDVITAANGDSVIAGAHFQASLTTQDNSEVLTVVASAYFDVANITKGASDTINLAANVYIEGPPAVVSGGYALCVDEGPVRIDAGVALGGGGTATLGTIGGSGPSSAGQAQWLEIDIDGTPHWIPAWT